MARRRKATGGTSRKSRPKRSGDPTTRALALVKASGILNPNVKLDAILKASENLGLDHKAARPKGFHTFIFREFIITEKPF